MTDRFVGPGGNDGSDGLTWATRKLTLNGVEDTPVVATDVVYVGPGVYRETLTCDVNGSSGNEITYIGDVTGENTDGVGGIVRITGSDDDQTATRGDCVNSGGRTFRIFRGFAMDTASDVMVDMQNANNWTLEDCYFTGGNAANVRMNEASQLNNTIRRCLFVGTTTNGPNLEMSHTDTIDNSGHLIENSIFLGGGQDNILIIRIGNVTIKNCTILFANDDGIDQGTAPAGGQTTTVENCIIAWNGQYGLEATATTDITEDFNTLYENATAARQNVNVGASSQTYPPLFATPILLDGFQLPWWFGELGEWSQIARIAGNSEATDDLFGIVRPTTSAKKSWGAIQLQEGERDTVTVRSGTASLKLSDAGDHHMRLPVDGTPIEIKCQVYREADYAGTNPRMIIRQPGVADDVTTDAAASGQWNELTTSITPATTNGWVDVIMRSLNTATSGSFATYFDDLEASR